MSFTWNRYSPQARGLVAWYPIIRANGARDYSGHGNHLTIILNTPTNSRAGNIHQLPAAEFLLSSSEGISGPNPVSDWDFSVSLRFRQDTNVDGQMWSISATSNQEYAGINGRNGFVATHTNRSTSAEGATSTPNNDPFQPGTVWRHAVGLFGFAFGQLYLDNIPGTLDTDVKNSPGTAWDRSAIGFLDKQSPAFYFTGAVADIRVYDHLLTVAEIAHIWNAQTRWDLYQPLDDALYVRAPIPGSPQFKQASFRIRNDDGNIIKP